MARPSFRERLDALRARVDAAARRAGRAPQDVAILAVAKTARAMDLQEAWAAGQRLFAHNRVQDLVRDAALLPAAEWHAIGPLQGNKVGECARVAAYVQTVGERKTAERLARAREHAAPLAVLLQVNLQPADGRYGCALEDLPALARAVRESAPLDLRGLMTIADPTADADRLRRGFARLREAADALARQGDLPERPLLSMGMSEDFEIAVEEGANLVRLGRALFPPVT
jgi:hypothetical protein